MNLPFVLSVALPRRPMGDGHSSRPCAGASPIGFGERQWTALELAERNKMRTIVFQRCGGKRLRRLNILRPGGLCQGSRLLSPMAPDWKYRVELGSKIVTSRAGRRTRAGANQPIRTREFSHVQQIREIAGFRHTSLRN